MLDIGFIRENPKIVKKSVLAKQASVDIDHLLDVDAKRREALSLVEELRQKRNEHSKSMQDGRPSDSQIETGKSIKSDLSAAESKYEEINNKYKNMLMSVPNVISDDTPIGQDENDNQVIRQWGEVPTFDFEAKDHVELMEGLGVLDVERAAKISGARFNFIKGDMALLQFALQQFVVNSLSDEEVIAKIIKDAGLDLPSNPFVPIIPPVLVRPETMDRMARLHPKDDRFLTLEEEYVLVGSAEHSLGAMYMDEILDRNELPLRYIGFSSAFRREAGSYGKDTRGILRQHQFDKLEMETFSTKDSGMQEHYLMVAIQEYLMQRLGLPYQVVAICSGDMGGPDYRQVDIETWLPGQSAYRETHTADYMTDYQSRRLHTRYRDDDEVEHVFMNDATAMAMGRALIAIVENYQTASGAITVPDVLRPYINKKEIA